MSRLELNDLSIQRIQTQGKGPDGGSRKRAARLISGDLAAIQIGTVEGKVFTLDLPSFTGMAQEDRPRVS